MLADSVPVDYALNADPNPNCILTLIGVADSVQVDYAFVQRSAVSGGALQRKGQR